MMKTMNKHFILISFVYTQYILPKYNVFFLLFVALVSARPECVHIIMFRRINESELTTGKLSRGPL